MDNVMRWKFARHVKVGPIGNTRSSLASGVTSKRKVACSFMGLPHFSNLKYQKRVLAHQVEMTK